VDTRDIAELVLEYLKVLAWPAVVLGAVVLFRRSLIRLLGRIREASAFGATVRLEEEAEQVAEASRQIPETQDSSQNVPQVDADPAWAASDDHALGSGRMLLAWSRLENMAGYAASLIGADQHLSVSRVLQRLSSRGLLSAEAVGVARGLQAIRNQLVHATNDIFLTTATVNDFVTASRELAAALEVAITRLRSEQES
jgi:hypothetical protein